MALCTWMRVCPCKEPGPLSDNLSVRRVKTYLGLAPGCMTSVSLSQAWLHEGSMPFRTCSLLCFVSHSLQNWLSLYCSSGRPVMFAFLTLTLALLSYRCSQMTLVIERRGLEKDRGNRIVNRRSRAVIYFKKKKDKNCIFLFLSFESTYSQTTVFC